MLESCYTIPEILRYSPDSWYQFRVFWWLILIEKRSRMSQDANGMKVEAWIDLKASFQCLCFREKFQFAKGSWGAACSLRALGFHSSSYIEAIRLKILHKIHGIQCFQYLISWNLFQIFSMCIWCQLVPINPKPSIID